MTQLINKSVQTVSLLFFLIAGNAFAQSPGFEVPEDFRDDIPAKEYKAGHITYLKTYFSECVVKNSANKDSINGNCPKFKSITNLTIHYTENRMEDISWIKHFDNLTSFTAENNYISILPDTFPAKLTTLSLYNNNIAIGSATDFAVLPEGLKTLNITNQRSIVSAIPKLPNSLSSLNASSNGIATWPDSLPKQLENLNLYGNKFTSLPSYIETIPLKILNVGYNKITSIDTLPNSLTELYLYANNITQLNFSTFPQNLIKLHISQNELTTLPNLNNKLSELTISNNNINALPPLPATLTYLVASNNNLTALPTLPANLQSINVYNNQISSISGLPSGLKSLNISNNLINTIPALPAGLETLFAANNTISAIPTLPATLKILDLSSNALAGNLTNLPSGLQTLAIANNQITGFTAPASLYSVDFSNNQVTVFPWTTIPANLRILNCVNNQITSIPTLPEGIEVLKASQNNFNCIPNLPASLLNTDIQLVCGKNCWKVLNGDWSVASNWSMGVVPTANDDVIILSGNPTVSEDVTIKSLDIRSGGISNTGGKLYVNGKVQNFGSYIDCDLYLSGTTGQIVLSKTSYSTTENEAHTYSPGYSNLIADNTAGITLSSNYSGIYAQLGVEKGFIDLNGQTIYINRLGYCANSTAIRNGNIKYGVWLPIGWSFIGTMIKNQKLSNLHESIELAFGGGKQSIYNYNGTLAGQVGWASPTGLTANFPIGVGYRVYNFASDYAYFTGLPFTGNHNFNVTYNTAGYDGGGWNLIANPYLSTIDWDNTEGWNKQKMDNAIYIWNPSQGQYTSYVNGIGQNGGSSTIAPTQAFFVKANAASPVLTINERAKTTYDTYRLRVAEAPVVRLKLSNSEQLEDEIVLRISDGTTFNFDSEFDALKWSGTEHNISIIGNDGKALSISSIPQAEGSYPLQFTYSNAGKYTFKVTDIENLNGSELILTDELMNNSVSLGNETEYEFTTSNNDLNRFRLSFVNAITSNNSSLNDQISIYPNPAIDQITIDLKNTQESELSLIDPMGRNIWQTTTSGKSIMNLPLNAGSGVYTLKVKTQGKTSNHKVIKLN